MQQVPSLIIRIGKLYELCTSYLNMIFGRLKFSNKFDLLVRKRIIYNVKHRYAIHFEFGGKFVTSPIKVELEAKASISFTIRKNLLYSVVSFRHLLPLS